MTDTHDNATPRTGWFSTHRREVAAGAVVAIIIVLVVALSAGGGGSPRNPLVVGNGGGPGGGSSQQSSGAATPNAAVQQFYTDLAGSDPASVCAVLAPEAQRQAAQGGLQSAEGGDELTNPSGATCAAAAQKLAHNTSANIKESLIAAAGDEYTDQQFTHNIVGVSDPNLAQLELQSTQAASDGDYSDPEPTIYHYFSTEEIGGSWFISQL